MIDEAQILKRCEKKDKKAQKILFDSYASVLLGVCRRYVNNLPDAEDILQEGFIKIYLNIKSFSGKGTLMNWMKKIMVNTAITYYHKNYKYRYHYDIEESEMIGIYTESNNSDYTGDELLLVIDSLPSGYKMVFNLYAIEGYKHREIAELLGIDVNTSKSQYSRARKLIQEKLARINITYMKK